MNNIFDFGKKKTIPQAMLFYVVSLIIAVIAAALAGAVMGATGNLEYARIAGLIAGSLVVTYFAYKIYKESNQNTLKIILLISGVIISFLFGGLFGLIPVALATLSNKETTKHEHL